MAKNKENTENPINGLYDEDGNLFGGEKGELLDVTDEDAGELAGEEAEVSLSQDELEALCRESVCPQCDVFKEAEELRLRAFADCENVKKRLLRETEEMKKYVGESILSDLLPILDNLDLALAYTDGLDAGSKNFVIGVDMTRKLFLDAVKNHGLETVAAEPGSEFNPEVHEAVGTVENSEFPDNHIVQMTQRGYILKGRLVRPAKVMVSKA